MNIVTEIASMRSDLERLQQRIEARLAGGINEDDPVIARMIGRKVELERAIGVIEQLQAEVERLRAANLDSVAWCKEAERERDQLKVILQQFMALNQHDRDLPLELFAIQRSVSAKAVSLATHDADAIEHMLSNMFHQKGMTASHYKCVELVNWIREYANQLRQQAKEVK